jgi:two-component system, NarL family, response regulator LiaR
MIQGTRNLTHTSMPQARARGATTGQTSEPSPQATSQLVHTHRAPVPVAPARSTPLVLAPRSGLVRLTSLPVDAPVVARQVSTSVREDQGARERRPTRVLIVDDHAVVRNGIAFSLLAFADLQVIGQASSGEEALSLISTAGGGGLQPDVVLMDLLMPGMGGVAAIRALRAALPEVAVVALTSFQEGSLVEEALQAGAIGYLLKDVEVDELGKAIRLAKQGMPILAPAAAQALVHTVVRRPPPIGADLTEREREVLGLLTHGLSNQQIAERLVITPATVKFHTRSIRSKLGTSTRTETVVLALHHHLVSS